ncbi:MAG TPA: DUF881 domain-containing protein [Candidatus Limnocylindrales bacterium]|nr:DUF881 domain-containing protein [Candidatus Limnocylindrales bacterium]
MNRLFAVGSRRQYLAIALVAAILGILAVGQLRGQSNVPGLSNLSTQDLTLLIANLNARNDELRTEIADLQQQAATLETSTSNGQTTVDQLQSDLARIRAWSGATGLTGTGVEIGIQGPIGSDAVEDLLNELANAGAEAIEVDGVRVVPGVVVAGDPGQLSVENTAVGDPFVIRAIGSPEILLGTLTRAGGVISQIGVTYPDAQISVTPLTSIDVPPTTRNLIPSHGQPSL